MPITAEEQRILVVDDNPGVARAVVMTILAVAGDENIPNLEERSVHTAHTVTAAIEKLNSPQRYAAIVVDSMAGGIDPIVQLAINLGIPAIVYSADDDVIRWAQPLAVNDVYAVRKAGQDDLALLSRALSTVFMGEAKQASIDES